MGNTVTKWNKPRSTKLAMWQLVWEVSSVSWWNGSHILSGVIGWRGAAVLWAILECYIDRSDARRAQAAAGWEAEGDVSQPRGSRPPNGQSCFSTCCCQSSAGTSSHCLLVWRGRWRSSDTWLPAGATALLGSLKLCFSPFKSFVSYGGTATVKWGMLRGMSESPPAGPADWDVGHQLLPRSGSIALLKLQKAWWSYSVFIYIWNRVNQMEVKDKENKCGLHEDV